jgi:hypothetical protein
VPPFERDPEPLTSRRTTARSILLALLGLTAGVVAQTAGGQTTSPDTGGRVPTPAPNVQPGGPVDPDPTPPPPPTTATPAPKPKPKGVPLGNRLVFPVVGPVQYTDDFGAPRPQGPHQGNDIMAPKRSLAVAAEDGTIKYGTNSARAGCYLYLYGKSKTYYLYIHLNNDLTSGNDNRGKCGPGVSYVKGLKNGQKVKAGEPIGYVGDSGDANGVASHLHFEVHPHGGKAVDPYPYLNRAVRLLFAVKRGTTFTLSVGGAVVNPLTGSLRVRVSSVRQFPDRYLYQKVNRTIDVSLPDSALVERKVGGVTRSVSAPLSALKKKAPLQLWTAPGKCTLQAQMGVPDALVANKITVLR